MLKCELWGNRARLSPVIVSQIEDYKTTGENAETEKRSNMGRCREPRVGGTKEDRRTREQKKWGAEADSCHST